MMLTICMGGSGCSKAVPKELSPDAYLQWIAEPEHQLCKKVSVGIYQLSMQYIPSEYTLYRQSAQGNNGDDSSARYSMTFVVSVGLDQAAMKNYTEKMGTEKQKEFREKRALFASDVETHLRMKTGTQEYTPSLVMLEDNGGMKDEFRAIVVFAPQQSKEELLNKELYQLTWNEVRFTTSIQSFEMNSMALRNLPALVSTPKSVAG